MKSKMSSNPLLIAFFTVFLDLLGFGIIIPIQAFFAESLGARPVAVTLLGASYSLMQFLFAHFWGRLSDKWGRRPIILFSVFISVVGHLIFGLSQTLAMLFFARMLAGFGNANIGTAQSIISDVTTKENRAKGMGIIGAAFGLGFIFGPVIGGLASKWGPSFPAFIASGLALVNFIFAYFFLPETLKKEDQLLSKEYSIFSLSKFRAAITDANIGRIFFMSFFFSTAFSTMEQVLSLFIEKTWIVATNLTQVEHIHAAAKLTSWYFIAVGITTVIIQGRLIGPVSKKFGLLKVSRYGLLVVLISMALMPTMISSLNLGLFFASAILIAIGAGFYNPSTMGLLSLATAGDEQGGVLGLNQSLASLGRVVGPGLAGWYFEQHLHAPFMVATGILLLVLFASMGLKNIGQTPAQP